MNGFNAYQETAVLTQSKGRMIVMLYDGAIKFLKQAIRNLEAKDYMAKGQAITKAQNIILELNTILDMEAGGEVAQNLRSLYNFMNKHLTQANTQSDARIVREVINLLEELNQSWRAITA